MSDDDTDGNVYQLRQPEDLLATYRNRRHDNVCHLPAHRKAKATGFEHLSDREFFLVAFGQEALESLTKEKTPLEVLDPARRADIEREFERRGRRIGW